MVFSLGFEICTARHGWTLSSVADRVICGQTRSDAVRRGQACSNTAGHNQLWLVRSVLVLVRGFAWREGHGSESAAALWDSEGMKGIVSGSCKGGRQQHIPKK